MRENRQSGSEGGGTETNRFFLPLSTRYRAFTTALIRGDTHSPRRCWREAGRNAKLQLGMCQGMYD